MVRDIYLDIARERVRQETKWGYPQLHPLDTEDGLIVWKQLLQKYRDNPNLHTWADILMEEVAEVFTAENTQALREELVQVAAVAVQLIENIDDGYITDD